MYSFDRPWTDVIAETLGTEEWQTAKVELWDTSIKPEYDIETGKWEYPVGYDSEFVQAPANDDTYAWVSQIPSMIAQAAVLEDRIIALVPLVTQATEAAQTAVQAAQDAAEILESFLELVGDTPPDQP